MIEKELLDKINLLFEYREFDYLFELASINDQQKEEILNKLIILQAKIYYLDAELEENWIIKDKDLKVKWDEIFTALSYFGLTKVKSQHYVAHIKKYQKHELELRANLLPTRLKMEYFYFYKSCDVKLLRKLIYDQFPVLRQYSSLADWRYFDLITEINDDVEDIFEDTTTINGNRFLISVINKGLKETSNTFNEFLEYINLQSSLRFNQNTNDLTGLIHQKTIKNIELTRDLIKLNLLEFNKYPKDCVKLFNHLDKKMNNLMLENLNLIPQINNNQDHGKK